jgi:trigger factor
VTTQSTELTDEEYRDELAAIMATYSYNEKITDRAVEEGDTVVTSYSGYKDGVLFQGGTSESSEVIAADGQGYIDGFGPAFVGQMPGVEFSFQVTFPAVYGNLELAGKEVTFVCTISHIKGENIITPELTDEFVRANLGYETVADFEKMLHEYLELQKKYVVENAMNEALWTQVMDNSTVLGYPDGEIARYIEIVKSDVAQTAAMYGVEYADFLANYLGMTEDQLNTVANEKAQKYVKENLIIYQIAKDLGIVITEEQFNENVKNAAAMNGVTEEVLLQYYGKDTIMLSLLQQEVFAVIAESANITVEETTGSAE